MLALLNKLCPFQQFIRFFEALLGHTPNLILYGQPGNPSQYGIRFYQVFNIFLDGRSLVSNRPMKQRVHWGHFFFAPFSCGCNKINKLINAAKTKYNVIKNTWFANAYAYSGFWKYLQFKTQVSQPSEKSKKKKKTGNSNTFFPGQEKAWNLKYSKKNPEKYLESVVLVRHCFPVYRRWISWNCFVFLFYDFLIHFSGHKTFFETIFHFIRSINLMAQNSLINLYFGYVYACKTLQLQRNWPGKSPEFCSKNGWESCKQLSFKGM